MTAGIRQTRSHRAEILDCRLAESFAQWRGWTAPPRPGPFSAAQAIARGQRHQTERAAAKDAGFGGRPNAKGMVKNYTLLNDMF
jgi:hypothetical protein